MPSRALQAGACTLGSTVALIAPAYPQVPVQDGAPPERVVITGARSVMEQYQLPTTTESVTIEQVMRSVNVVNTEDALKYLPSIVVRKRHIGDTQAPISTRTSGVGASARSLIYADGVLLSALIGNNNSFASPRWGMVAPDQIERIDVLYGPFAAQYPGNSIGAVVEIATRMPREFTLIAHARGAWQHFEQYATSGDFPAYEMSALMGDRSGRFAWRASVNHLYSRNQPLAYVTATRPASPNSAGTAATGAFADLNRTGAPIAVLGAGGLERQVQDNLTFKATYDLSPAMTLSYTVGVFLNDDDAGVETYLRDADGNPLYSGSLNIGGYNYAVGAGAFSSNLYRLDETHWMHSAALKSSSPAGWSWELVASLYDFGESEQRTPSAALPAAFEGGAGSITDMEGTGWYTADLRVFWRPDGATGRNQLSFGAHADRYTLSNERNATADWMSGEAGALITAAKGKTEMYAVWLQDVWRVATAFKLTLGGRYEYWRAYHGFNYSLTPALSVAQPELDAANFSPKASLAWEAMSDWLVTASLGSAYRFPTVSELYQAITTGATLSVPNPDLRPEHALSTELAVEHALKDGRVRVSVFTEDISDALISQSAPLLPGSTTLFNYVQNVDHVQSRGVEAVLQKDDVFIEGLSFQGSVTYVDSEIDSDPAFAAAVGKQTPQIPRWRATLVATYQPNEQWSFTLAARYSDRVFATIDNSDIHTHTYQGFDSYFVLDARVSYQVNERWSVAVGADNLNDARYFLFHPFPQRTLFAELSYGF
jgi:iron complex outermembrane recepter protein